MNEKLVGINNNMNTRLDVLNNTMNERLDSLENSVEEIKSTAGQCCKDPTGRFLDPAHNCSHIVQTHPAGKDDIHTLIIVLPICAYHQVTTGYIAALAMQ